MINRLLILCSALTIGYAQTPHDASRIEANYVKLPLHFEPAPTPGEFVARGSGFSVAISGSAAVVKTRLSNALVKMELIGAKRSARAVAVKPLMGKVNYLIGNDPRKWRRNLSTFAEVRVPGIRPGVELVYYGNQRQLEYDLILAPGADPASLVWQFSGVDRLTLEADGSLKAGPLAWRRPEIYQQVGDRRQSITGAYRLLPSNRVGFVVGNYDPSLPLVIDPILVYSTVLGGATPLNTINAGDIARKITVDAQGQVYLTGTSEGADFPLLNPAQTPNQGDADVFVTKMNASGSGIIFSTYLGGTGREIGRAIALDASSPPNVYVGGQTTSSNFPVVGAVQPTYGGGTDAFITKLNGNGSAILFSTYHGGTSFDIGRGIGVNPADGTAYLTGATFSPDLPVANALQPALAGSSDAYLVRFSPSGNTRLFSTFLGGTGNDTAYALALDAAGNPYLVGESDSANFPNDRSIQSSPGGGFDVFVTKFNPTGSVRLFSHVLGGTSGDSASGVAVDASNAVYIAGLTASTNFPVVNALQPALAGDADAFVTKINPAGNSLVYSTYLGGPFLDDALGIAVDPAGRAHITGYSGGGLNTVNAVMPEKFGGSSYVLRSTNNGATFAPSGQGIVNSSYSGDFPVIAFESPQVVYTVSDLARPYRSDNGGTSWASVGPNFTFGQEIRIILPTAAGAVWVGSSNGLYRTTNSGVSWSLQTPGLPSPINVTSLVVNPQNQSELYVGSNGGGVYRTTDAGASWAPVSVGLPSQIVTGLYLNPANPSELLAGTDVGLFRTTNSGITWSQFGPGWLTGLSSISRQPISGELFGRALSSQWVSGDGGQTWSAINPPESVVMSKLVVDPANAAHYLAIGAANLGLWRSTDRGTSWTLVAGPDITVLDVAFAPGSSGTVVATMSVSADAFAARLEPTGNTLSFLTYLGSSRVDSGNSVATDAMGNTYVAGQLGSVEFPTTSDAFQRRTRANDAFLVKIATDIPPPACSFQLLSVNGNVAATSAATSMRINVVAPSGCSWTASSSAPWIRILNGSSRVASGSFVLTLAHNAGAANRSADITVGDQILRIEQAGSVCGSGSFPFSSANFPLSGGSRSGLLSLAAGCSWTLFGDENNWLTVSPTAGVGPTNITLTAAPNPSRASRSATVSFGPHTVVASQDGFCSLSFSSLGSVVGAGAGTGQFNLSTGAGCPWTLTTTNANVTLTSPTSGTGPATISYSYGANLAPTPRKVTISAGPSINHVVVQNGSSCVFSLPSNSQSISALATNVTIAVSGSPGCGYTASSPAAWATVTSGPIHSVPASTVLYVAANPGPSSRVATLTIAGQSFTLTQSGPACQFGLTASSTVSPAAGLAGAIAIGASLSNCSWTATSSAPWLRFTSSSTGAGSANLNFVIDPNPSPFGRTATVSVNGQSVTFTQAGTGSCSAGYSIAQSTIAFAAAAGSASVAITAPAGCAWTATSSEPWVTVTPSGTGPGVLTLNIASHPGASSRTATITIAGLSLVVIQASPASTASCTFEAAPVNVRAEGRTEMLAELRLNCTGLPLNVLADLELTINTNVTNQLTDGFSDATLSVSGAAARLAQLTGYNSLRWPAVRLPAGNSVLRFSNVRVDASLLSTPSSLAPIPITANLLLNSATPIPVTNATAVAARAVPGLIVQTGTPSQSGAFRTLPVLLSEGFAASFRTGPAENTRLRLELPGLPPGVRLYAPIFPTGGSSQLVSADENGMGGASVPGTTVNGSLYQELFPVAGVVTATWQLSASDTVNAESLTVPLLVQNASDSQFAALLGALNGTFAPVSPVAVSRPGAPFPRFRNFNVPQRRVNLRITSRVTADLSAAVSSKNSGSRALFAINAPIVITTVVTNESEIPANGATIRNNLPSGILLRNCSITCTNAGGQVTVPLGTLAPGESRTVLVNATVGPLLTQGGAVSNRATADSEDPTADLASASSSASIDLLPGPPAVALPEPISGTGLTKTFVFQYSNPNGFQRLGVLNALINNALDGGNACYIAYSVPAGILFLVNDRGVADGLSAPLVLGTNNSVSNSQCVINGLNSSAFGSGNDFTLTLEITFRPSFSGSKIVYLAARDEQERNSGWTSSGFHQVPGGTTTFPNPQMAPPIGTTSSGILSFIYEDQTNNANLQTLWALANTALDGRNACYVVYFAPGNLIGVVPDNGDGGALSLIPLSGSATTGNSQCQINTFGSSVVRSGNRLTLNLNMTFRPGFAGNRIVWMAGQTVAGQVSPWKASGAWQVPP